MKRGDVLDALRALSRGRVPTRSPLGQLQVVRRSVERAGFRATPQALELELGRVLLDATEAELQRLRRLAGVVPRAVAEGSRPRGVPYRNPDETPETIRAAIRADYAMDHRGLESVSAVYHLYLRPDLGLSLDGFVRVLGDRHRRTVQRRLQHGTGIITRRLMELERRCALRERSEGVPHSRSHTPFGR